MNRSHYLPLSKRLAEEAEPGDNVLYDTLPDRTKTPSAWYQPRVIFPWVLCLLSLSTLALQRTTWNSKQCNADGIWGPFEIQAAKDQVSLKMREVKFTGTLKIIDGIGLVREIDENSPPYAGTPSPEMDAAWEALVYPLNLFIREEEMEGNLDGTSPDPGTGLYVAMPQGFHDLHCLNMIRQRLSLEYYPHLADMNQTVLSTHIDHCIDSLRQSLMCTGDMTLIKEYWMPDRNRMMANFDNVHTCRDFDALKKWSVDRSAEDGSPWLSNAEKLLGVA